MTINVTKLALGLSAAFVLCLTPAASFAGDTVTSVSVGMDYSSGSYGDTTDTSILFIPVTGKVETGPWTFKAVVPWVQIDGPGSLVDEVLPGGLDAKENGLGDVVLSISYLFFPKEKGGAFYELTGKVKLPTADEEKGLGSGETDYTVQADVFKPVGDRTTLFAGAGYRVRGDSDFFELEDGWLANVGVSHKLSDATSTGLMVNYRQAASLTGDDPLEVTPFVSWKTASKDWSVNLYATFGLSDASPDNGVGISFKRSMR
jgi:hypothetical protein